MTTDLNEIVFQAGDVEDMRYVLRACKTFLEARDLQMAQIDLRNVRPSALTVDVERVATRLDHYFSQYLIERHEALLAEDDLGLVEDETEAPEASGELGEGDSEPLSDAPLGSPKVKRQAGRRLTKKELAPSDE